MCSLADAIAVQQSAPVVSSIWPTELMVAGGVVQIYGGNLNQDGITVKIGTMDCTTEGIAVPGPATMGR